MRIDILDGTVVGRTICHTWYDENTREQSVWLGQVEKERRSGTIDSYNIAYWAEHETYEDSTDCDISRLALAANLICEDVIFCLFERGK